MKLPRQTLFSIFVQLAWQLVLTSGPVVFQACHCEWVFALVCHPTVDHFAFSRRKITVQVLADSNGTACSTSSQSRSYCCCFFVLKIETHLLVYNAASIARMLPITSSLTVGILHQSFLVFGTSLHSAGSAKVFSVMRILFRPSSSENAPTSFIVSWPVSRLTVVRTNKL